MKNFSSRLKELRLKENLTLKELSNETHLSVSSLSCWENGTKTPSVNAAITLAQFFGVTTDFILGLTDQ